MNNNLDSGQLKERLSFLESILDDSHDVIIAGDMQGHVVEFNKGAELLLGYKKEEIIGKPIDILYFNPADRQELVKIMEEKGVVVDHDIKSRSKTGQLIQMSTTMSYLRDEKEHIIGTIGIAKDIRTRKQLEKQRVIKSLTYSILLLLIVGITIIVTYVIATSSNISGETSLLKNELKEYKDRSNQLETVLNQTKKQLTEAQQKSYELKNEKEDIAQQLAQTRQEISRLKIERSDEFTRVSQTLALKEKELENVNQKRVFVPSSAIGKNVIILKKELPFTRMLTTYYWNGRLKEIKKESIVIIDENNQSSEIALEEIWGYKID